MLDLIKNKKFVAVYLVWFLIQTTLLLMGGKVGNSYNPKDYFWPFSDYSYTQIYDISEWFFYMSAPLIIIYLIKVFKDNNTE